MNKPITPDKILELISRASKIEILIDANGESDLIEATWWTDVPEAEPDEDDDDGDFTCIDSDVFDTQAAVLVSELENATSDGSTVTLDDGRVLKFYGQLQVS